MGDWLWFVYAYWEAAGALTVRFTCLPCVCVQGSSRIRALPTLK